ncbi:MAG TPA: hypothetical protein DCL09_01310 [Sutterella sp.]|nr:hypothetical protein [Sutterella sp.]
MTAKTTLAERLNALLQEKGATKVELANACGIKPPSINNLCSGKSQSMMAATALRMARFFNVSYSWLVFGEGSREPSDPDAPVEPGPDVKQYVPLISWVQAGNPSGVILDDSVEKIPSIRHMSDGSFALRVRGESMLPLFVEGDIIFVDPAREPRNKSYVVVSTPDNETTFKQLVADDEIQYLRPLNTNWPGPQIIPFEDGMTIIGVVVGKWVDI